MTAKDNTFDEGSLITDQEQLKNVSDTDETLGSEEKSTIERDEEQEKTVNDINLDLKDDQSSDSEEQKPMELDEEDGETTDVNEFNLKDNESSSTKAKSIFVIADLNLKDDDSSGSKEQSLLDEVPTFLPTRRRLSLKMKSTGNIGTASTLEGVHDLKQIIQSFKRSEVNHYRISDLFSDNSVTNIEDSHTSYRKDLEREITELKVKLAVAQERADTLQNNYNKVSYENQVCVAKMNDIVEKYEEKKNHSEQLEMVVAHLQGKAEEASEVRKVLQEKVEKMEKMTKSTRKHKQEIRELKRNVEGLGMEKHGLKVEIDWLKKQLQTPTQDDVSSLGESSENPDEEAVTGIQEYLSFPAPSGLQTSKKSLAESKEDDDDSSQSHKGLFSTLQFPSFSMIDPPSTPIRNGAEEEASQVTKMMDSRNKNSVKSSFFSFLGVGTSETNLKTIQSQSDHDSEEHVQYQPNSSSRLLVPRRLNENY